MRKTAVKTIEEAVQLYLEAFGEQFQGEFSLGKKRQWLGRFVTYLKEQGHSMKLSDLTLEDGQGFLDSIAHAYQGHQMSPQTKKRYKCAIRSFSRFLNISGCVEQDVFFALKAR